MPPSDDDETERRPTLSLSRLKVRASQKTIRTSKDQQHKKQQQQQRRRKRRRSPAVLLLQDMEPFAVSSSLPSFQEERKRLDQLFHSSSDSSSSDDDNNKKQRKVKEPSITRRRRYKDMPIPSFAVKDEPSFAVKDEQADEVLCTEDDDDDDDLDLLLGDGKPVFATASKPKTMQQSARNTITAATCITATSSSSSISPKPTNTDGYSVDYRKENDHIENESSLMTMGEATTTASFSSQEPTALQNAATNTQGQDKKFIASADKEEKVEAASSEGWTESDILSAAEQCARNILDPSKKFSMKLVYAELDKSPQVGNVWADIAKRNTVKEHVLNCLGPTEEQLLQTVDRIFKETNIETSTVKQVLASVQARFHIPLSSLMRERIRRRLAGLITEKIQPSSTAISSTGGCSNVEQQSLQSNNSGSLRVPQEALFQAVDQTFLESNIETCTLKQAVAKVQARFSVPFSAETRKLIKQRLQLLIKKEIQPNIQPTNGDAARKKQNNVESKSSANAGKVVPVVQEGHGKDASKPPRSLTGLDAASALISETFASRETLDRKAADVQGNLNSKAPPVIDKPGRTRKARIRKPKDETATDKTKPSTRGNRKRKASCQLCCNCPCTLSTTTTTEPANTKTTIDLAQSDAAIEKVLIKRLQKAEKLSEQYDNQLDTIRRALKKHRREMWKKLEESNAPESALAAKKSTERFLPDAGEFEQLAVRYRPALGTDMVQCAQNKMFGGVGSAFQPTLTQMFRGGDKNDMENDKPKFEQVKGGGQLEIIDEQPELELEDDEGETNSPDNQTSEDGVQNGTSNDKEEEDDDDDDDDDDDELGLSTVEKTPFSRVEYNPIAISGGETAVESIWQSMLNGNYTCSWDTLFADPCDDEDEAAAMEDLLGLLGEEGGEDEKGHEDVTLKLSMLSPRGKHLAERIIEKVSNSPKKLSALEHDCPSWKENVIFGAGQSGSTDVSDALDGVRMSRAKLLEARAAILNSIDRKLSVLDVFEDVLHQSLTRLVNGAD